MSCAVPACPKRGTKWDKWDKWDNLKIGGCLFFDKKWREGSLYPSH